MFGVFLICAVMSLNIHPIVYLLKFSFIIVPVDIIIQRYCKIVFTLLYLFRNIRETRNVFYELN